MVYKSGHMTDIGTKITLTVGACGTGNVVNLPSYLIAARQLPSVKVQVVLTRSAEQILPVHTVGLFCDRVVADSVIGNHFDPGHMRLALESDLLLILPASAHMLAASALGLADSLLSTAVLGSPHPVLFFPSMNMQMWTKPSVQRNVNQLKADGHTVVEPKVIEGYEIATGCLTQQPALVTPQQFAGIIHSEISRRQPSIEESAASSQKP